jgi:hypothetical protein
MIHLTYKFYPENTDTESPSCTDTKTTSVSVLLTVLVRIPRPPLCTDTEAASVSVLAISRPQCIMIENIYISTYFIKLVPNYSLYELAAAMLSKEPYAGNVIENVTLIYIVKLDNLIH